MNERKKERKKVFRQESEKVVIKYMYITLHLQVHVIYLPISVALD